MLWVVSIPRNSLGDVSNTLIHLEISIGVKKRKKSDAGTWDCHHGGPATIRLFILRSYVLLLLHGSSYFVLQTKLQVCHGSCFEVRIHYGDNIQWQYLYYALYQWRASFFCNNLYNKKLMRFQQCLNAYCPLLFMFMFII